MHVTLIAHKKDALVGRDADLEGGRRSRENSDLSANYQSIVAASWHCPNCILITKICISGPEAKTTKPEIGEDLQKYLLDSKTQLCEFLRSEIAQHQNLLHEKMNDEEVDDQLETSNEEDRQLRLKVLRFGLDERKKKIQDTRNEADSLASKLNSMKIEAYQKKLTAITEMYSNLDYQHRMLHNFRKKVESMHEELSKTKIISLDGKEETVNELGQKINNLLSQINKVKSEILELDSKPILLKANLEESIKSKKAAIEKAEQDSAFIKSKIRQKCKQLKLLQPVGSETKKKLQKLDDLNHRLSAVSKRLEFAENLDRRTQDVLSRQELRVENAKSKFNRVKELYAEEKRIQSAQLSELEAEKEEQVQKLMCLNKKLDRLGRQNLLKGTTSAYKWIMASFDISDDECDEEIDECVGKRCAFICLEIKRLQQHSAWLEENLKAAETKSLNRQKMSAIKAVLDKGRLQTDATDVRRRNQNRTNRPRPISMIETVTKKITRSATMQEKVSPAQVDVRRRTMIINRPTLSQVEPTVSATQRRLVYSQSLRERGINPRTPLSHLQRGMSSNSVSLTFRSPTPLIYTAFRSSKYTASSSRALDFAA
nr:conserved hypothetical protein [Hymenolepis microstoma]